MRRPLLSWLLTALSSQICKTIVQLKLFQSIDSCMLELLKIFNSHNELFHSSG